MMEKGIVVDVRGITPDERLKKVSAELDNVNVGELVEIVADDERMLKLAPMMVKSIGKAKFVKSWAAEDGFYHTLVRRE
ncbi:MAG: hypothetical protein DRG37_08230 [Deltaproteobacteria bacterium]|nr:MAG: hypothetical protein DRG37_08230 [Deltaproteobacteria bacterium]